MHKCTVHGKALIYSYLLVAIEERVSTFKVCKTRSVSQDVIILFDHLQLEIILQIAFE